MGHWFVVETEVFQELIAQKGKPKSGRTTRGTEIWTWAKLVVALQKEAKKRGLVDAKLHSKGSCGDHYKRLKGEATVVQAYRARKKEEKAKEGTGLGVMDVDEEKEEQVGGWGISLLGVGRG